MRYGENPQQDADFYQKGLPTAYSIASAKQLNGKELSFNNIRDADAAIRIIRDFKDRPTVVALKHMNPCGIGQADDIETAWDYAYEADPVSIFGGIVVLNREVEAATAKKIHGDVQRLECRSRGGGSVPGRGCHAERDERRDRPERLYRNHRNRDA